MAKYSNLLVAGSFSGNSKNMTSKEALPFSTRIVANRGRALEKQGLYLICTLHKLAGVKLAGK